MDLWKLIDLFNSAMIHFCACKSHRNPGKHFCSLKTLKIYHSCPSSGKKFLQQEWAPSNPLCHLGPHCVHCGVAPIISFTHLPLGGFLPKPPERPLISAAETWGLVTLLPPNWAQWVFPCLMRITYLLCIGIPTEHQGEWGRAHHAGWANRTALCPGVQSCQPVGDVSSRPNGPGKRKPCPCL